MLKWECTVNQGVQQCQIPYNEEGISSITNLIGIIALLIFSGYAFFKLLTAFFK